MNVLSLFQLVLLKKEGIQLNVKVSNKQEAINKLVELMNNTGNLANKEEYKKTVMAREELSTTGIGDGIAIPHGKTNSDSSIGIPISPHSNFPLCFFPTVTLNIFCKTILEIPVV